MRLTWHGHSCFSLESESGTVILDPYARGSVPGVELPELTADLVLCSHDHFDHNAADRVRLTGRTPRCSVESFETFHDGEGGALRGTNLVRVVTMDSLRVAHLGDLGTPLPKELTPRLRGVDCLLLPIGGVFTIDSAEALRVAAAVDAVVTVPMHYRGAGFGFDVLETVDAFAKARGAERIDGASVELTPGMGKRTVVLKL